MMKFCFFLSDVDLKHVASCVASCLQVSRSRQHALQLLKILTWPLGSVPLTQKKPLCFPAGFDVLIVHTWLGSSSKRISVRHPAEKPPRWTICVLNTFTIVTIKLLFYNNRLMYSWVTRHKNKGTIITKSEGWSKETKTRKHLWDSPRVAMPAI